MPTTPYMSLLLPTVSVTLGPTYATELNAALGVLDSHDHTSGKGVLVPTDGINVNSDLPFNSYNATSIRSARFTAQGSPIALAPDIGCLFVSGVDLYFNDGNGNHIQLTAGGAINASSIGGIGGDYSTSSASVFYTSASKTFSFWQDTNKSALMDCGSILLRRVDNTASAAITIKPDTSLSSGWTLTLPTAAPGAQAVVQIDSAGALSFSNTIPSATITTLTATTIVNSQLLAPSGTKLLFYQAAAPSGWTRDTSANDKFIRVVSAGSPGTTGGTIAASSDISTHVHAGPSHTHNLTSGYAQFCIGNLVGNTTNVIGKMVSVSAWTATHKNSGLSGVSASSTTPAEGLQLAGNADAGGTGNTGNATGAGVGVFAYADVLIATKN